MEEPRNKFRGSLINLAGVAAVFLILVWASQTGMINKYIQGVIIQCCYSIIMAVSLNITIGFLGQIALGHSGFMAVGAYTSALVTKALTNAGILADGSSFSNLALLMIGVLCGALLAALCGLLVGIPALRLRGDYLAIITLGFGEIIRVVIQNLPFAGGKGLADGQAGQALIGIKNLGSLYSIYFIMAVTVTVLFAFVRSKYGRAIRAIREDDIASEASGIHNTYFKVLTFTVSAFFAGVAGAVFAHRGLGTLQHSDFTFLKSTEYVIMVVLGGMGSLTGSMIAAITLSVLPEALRAFSTYRMLVYSVVLVIVMIFRPTGLCGTYEFSLARAVFNLPANLKALPRNLRRLGRRFAAWVKNLPRAFGGAGKGGEDDDETTDDEEGSVTIP